MERLVNLIKEPNWKLILYDLVNSNEFNIWDIDLIKLTDLYLQKIQELKENNLLVPANALLTAAILLKLKAYKLKLTSIDQEDLDLKYPDDEFLSSDQNLENITRIKEGQVSLDDLIDVVDYLMNKPTKSNIKRKIDNKSEPEFVLPKKTENINKRIDSLYGILKDKVDMEGCTTFSRIYDKNDVTNIVNNYFIPLLFLSQQEKVNIWQDGFFSEIFIKII